MNNESNKHMNGRVEIIRIVTLALLLAGTSYGQVMRNPTRSLFSDYKAAKVGDAVTVIITEQSSASKDQSTNTSRASNVGLTGALSVGNATGPSGSGSLGTTNDFKGSGSTSEAGSVQATVSAQVVKVDQYGNLVIRGSRDISINGQDQIIKISGIIRPSDILPDNTIYSSQISDAKIVFEGSGSVNSAQNPSWLMAIFHWLF